MACNTNRCALRRFDGHGSGSYRPSNSGLAKEAENNLAAMIAARNKLDSDLGLSVQKEKPEMKTQNYGNLILAKSEMPESIHIPEVFQNKVQPEIFTTWKTPRASSDYQK